MSFRPLLHAAGEIAAFALPHCQLTGKLLLEISFHCEIDYS